MLEGIVTRLNTNYIISTFIPALGFVLISITIFEPIVPASISKQLPLAPESFSQSNVSTLLILILTLILGFILSGLMIFFYKVTEGYYILVRFPVFRQHHQQEAIRLKKQIHTLEELLRVSKTRRISKSSEEVLKDKIYYLKSVYEQKYPPEIGAVLPTRFGNILRAAETHARTRYGMDAVPMWPRLTHVIPESYYQRVQQANNSLAFLVNCMVLSCLLAVFCLMASGYQYFVWNYAEGKYAEWLLEHGDGEVDKNDVPVAEPVYFVEINLSERMQTIYQQRAALYLLVFGFFLTMALFFYNASLTTVFQYGEMIRSSYDLFRFDLLRQLRLPMPENLETEYRDWRMLSELIAIGHSGGKKKINPDYAHYASQETTSEEQAEST